MITDKEPQVIFAKARLLDMCWYKNVHNKWSVMWRGKFLAKHLQTNFEETTVIAAVNSIDKPDMWVKNQ